MSQVPPLRPLPEEALPGLEIFPERPVDLRRDIYQFVSYAKGHSITRSYRENAIPKAHALKLARLLSYEKEAEEVEESGFGSWSNYVSRVARALGLVSFEVEGVYRGYSSYAQSFPKNEIKVEERAWGEYLRKAPREKERAILEALLSMTSNEFFRPGTLIEGESFDTFGSGIGPASKMKLPEIRRGLLALFAELRPEVWYEQRDLVELVRARRAHLILDPETREPDFESRSRLQRWEWESARARKGKPKPPRPEVTLQDIYTNFREPPRGEHHFNQEKGQITSRTKDAFHKVEGRYLEWFFREIPYLAGFVALAYRGERDPHGMDVAPTFERLRAVRFTQHFFQLMRGDEALDKVKLTALPTFEIIVEALSYPDEVLSALAPFTVLTKEARPIYQLKLERKRVVEAAAQNAQARPAQEILAALTSAPLPENVARELKAWTGHAEKLTIYEGFGLLEVHDKRRREELSKELEPFLEASELEGFALLREPEAAFQRLEERLHVPTLVRHKEMSFEASLGRLAPTAHSKPRQRPKQPSPPSPKKVSLEPEDLIGYRAPAPELLAALHEALRGEARTCLLLAKEGLLVISAPALPKLKTALRRLSERFDVEL
jgi:hypothetical protein